MSAAFICRTVPVEGQALEAGRRTRRLCPRALADNSLDKEQQIVHSFEVSLRLCDKTVQTRTLAYKVKFLRPVLVCYAAFRRLRWSCLCKLIQGDYLWPALASHAVRVSCEAEPSEQEPLLKAGTGGADGPDRTGDVRRDNRRHRVHSRIDAPRFRAQRSFPMTP